MTSDQLRKRLQVKGLAFFRLFGARATCLAICLVLGACSSRWSAGTDTLATPAKSPADFNGDAPLAADSLPDSLDAALSAFSEPPLEPAPSAPAPPDLLTIPELEEILQQALELAAQRRCTPAEDLLFILQDQTARPLPASCDSLYARYRGSLERRLVYLGGLLAEAKAWSGPSAGADTTLAAAYESLSPLAFPDSLLPVTGPRRSALVADLLRVDNAAVRKWERYFTGNGRKHYQVWLNRKAAADSLIGALLSESGLPRQLIYLAMIESGISPYARSNVGAQGPWQFMPGTAKRFRLGNDWWVDERRDLEMSTRAAVAYLKQLYRQFADWALVLAAYNSGENRIARAIRRDGHDNYWRLRLPAQTAEFVPKFIAAARLGEDPESYGLTSPEVSPLRYEVIAVDDATDLKLVAKCAGVTAEEVFSLNPALLRRSSPPDRPGYPVRVPVGTSARCRAALRKIPAADRLTWRRHRIQSGETLGHIAQQFGTSVRELAQLNKLPSVNLIRPGDQLLIPMPTRLADKARERAAEKGHYVPPDGYERISYRVKSGDTLGHIANRLGVSLKHLRKVNGMQKKSLIRPGQRLYAYRPAGSG